MPKTVRGGKRGNSAMNVTSTTAQTSTPAPAPTPVLTPRTPGVPVLTKRQMMSGMQGGAVSFAQFEKMTDAQKAAVLSAAINEDVPNFLSDSSLQRIAYSLGMNDKPTLVDSAAFDKLPGTTLYRTVSDVYNSRLDFGYKSNNILDQINKGDFTRYSDTGGSVHGRGIYFADDYQDSAWYGNGGKKDSMMRMKFAKNTKIITESNANKGITAEIKNNTALGRLLLKCDDDSAVSVYALTKGYDAIDAGGYKVVINRRCMVVDKNYKSNPQGSRKW